MEAITDTTNVMDEANMADCGNKHSLVYLASPYSDDDESVRADRAQAAAEVMAKLLDKGINVFSPIVCMDGLAKFRKGEPTDYEAWDSICEAMIERCDSFMVLTLDGWQKSKGIRAEMEFAREIGMPIRGVNIHGSPVKIDWRGLREDGMGRLCWSEERDGFGLMAKLGNETFTVTRIGMGADLKFRASRSHSGLRKTMWVEGGKRFDTIHQALNACERACNAPFETAWENIVKAERETRPNVKMPGTFKGGSENITAEMICQHVEKAVRDAWTLGLKQSFSVSQDKIVYEIELPPARMLDCFINDEPAPVVESERHAPGDRFVSNWYKDDQPKKEDVECPF